MIKSQDVEEDLSQSELEELAREATSNVRQSQKIQKADEVFWTTSFQSQNILLPKAEAFYTDSNEFRVVPGAGKSSLDIGHVPVGAEYEAAKTRQRLARGTSHGATLQPPKQTTTVSKRQVYAFGAIGFAIAACGMLAWSMGGQNEEAPKGADAGKNVTLAALPSTKIKSTPPVFSENEDSPEAKSLAEETNNNPVDVDTKPPAIEDKAAKASTVRAISDGKNKKAEAKRGSKSTENATSKKVQKTSPKIENKSKPEKTALAAKNSEPKSIKDLLSSATTDSEPKASSKEESPGKTVTKSRIDRSDVSKAMSKVSGRAGKCQKIEDVNETVSVKFTVSPSGQILKAKAKGKHENSKTGLCVVKAVKSATFPPFNGRPTSFTYPFLMIR